MRVVETGFRDGNASFSWVWGWLAEEGWAGRGEILFPCVEAGRMFWPRVFGVGSGAFNGAMDIRERSRSNFRQAWCLEAEGIKFDDLTNFPSSLCVAIYDTGAWFSIEQGFMQL